MTDTLTALARAGPDQLPPVALIQSALQRMQTFLDCENPTAAGFNVPELLALADRVEDLDLSNEIVAVVATVLAHPRLSRRARDGIAGAAYRLLEDGAWADPVAGARNLAAVGLRRPPRRPGDR